MMAALLALAISSAGLVTPALCFPKAYVGLYADAGHSLITVSYAGSTTMFTLWIYWLPSDRGIQAVEYRIVYPSNVAPGAATVSPLHYGLGGCELPAGSCAFESCQAGWAWSHYQICYLLDSAPSAIEITGTGFYLRVATCELGYPLEDVTVLNYLYLNQPGQIAVDPQSWGTIKSLFR